MNGISFVTCFSSNERAENLRASIERSIGRASEWEFIPQAGRPRGAAHGDDIFQAYNLGLDRAMHDVIVFVHDDVTFLSSDYWIDEVRRHLADEAVGLLGVAGTSLLLPDVGWWEPALYPESCLSGDILELITNRQVHFGSGTVVHGPPIAATAAPDFDRAAPTCYGPWKEVVALDGLFLCGRKQVLRDVGGFADYLQGFHFYDIDLCIRIKSAGLRIHTIPLLLHHLSPGASAGTPEWKRDLGTVATRWADRFPLTCEPAVQRVLARRSGK